METPTDKAIDYCIEVEGQIHQPYIDAFIAGYKAANEWISVKDELPKRGIDVLCKSKSFFESGYNEVCILIGFLRVDKDEFIVAVWNQHDMVYESLEIEKSKVEYWKPIE